MLHKKPHRKNRAAALLLSAVMLVSSIHLTPPASAGYEWVQDSVNRLSSWGVLAGREGGLELDASISRAEFTAMVNRAYGYTETTSIPFSDVPVSAWYSDDIAIGYNTGYLTGTTPTTASPTNALTREEAITLLARNLRLPVSTGEVTEFTDGRTFSNWSSGYIKAAAESGLLSGYEDGTFRPKNEISRAELIKLLADSLGTLINTPGSHSLGGILGNVTINTSGVTLSNTVIGGDLYLTGGVGLGGVTLDNVTVLGRIIVAGGGESEGGSESIMLRNVAAQSMLVDTMAGQAVSLSVQNDSVIPEVTLKSNAFIEDYSRNGLGLMNIIMDGGEDMRVTLSGNIQNVVNKTPDSRLVIGDGTAQSVTIDETAVNSTLTITNDGTVETLNLDVGIRVDGEGDIGSLYVNAEGARVEMLPDDIIIRPGITANINGVDMDTKLGEEASSAPRILAGYPRADDIAPNSVLAVFSGNKSGTIHYAVTPSQYGPVEDSDILVNPPTYGPTYTARGTVALTASETEASVRIGGLTVAGTYYLSAVLVDSRGDRSDIKYIEFTTPDNTVPNFVTGYPVISNVTDIDAQLSAMTNKDCEMYFAIFPKGSAAPTANNFLSDSLTGSIASGVYAMIKNTPMTDWLTGIPIAGGAGSINGLLEEEQDYDLYLWLTDREGGLSSAVRKLTIRTIDVSAPEFVTLPYVTDEAAKSVTLTGSLDEDGTIYWVAVPEGEEYPKAASSPTIDTGAHAVTVVGGTGGGTYKPGDLVTIVPENITDDVFYRWQVEQGGVTPQLVSPEGSASVSPGTATFRMPDEAVSITAYFISKADADSENPDPRLIRGTTITSGSGVALDSEYAKLQVRNGLNAFKKGSTSAKEMADFKFTVSGLDAQSRYDVYYIAVDKAGNYSNPVRKITVNTQDNIAPKVTQEFTRFPEGDSVSTTHPYANTDIRLIFDEEVASSNSTRSFLDLYRDVVAAKNNPQELVIAQETLGSVLSSSIKLYTAGSGTNLPEVVGDDIIDFRKAIITLEDDGKMVITFRTTNNPDTNALHLHSGTTYFFRLSDIIDTSTAHNRMAQIDLPRFTTIAAQVFLQSENVTRLAGQLYPDTGLQKEADIAFSLTPMSTSTVDDSIDWDMLIWLNTQADFELYRSASPNGPWRQIRNKRSNSDVYTVNGSEDSFTGVSVDLRDSLDDDYPQLNKDLVENRKYYYAIHFTQIGVLSERRSWSSNVTAQINIMAGSSVELSNLANNVTKGYASMVSDRRVDDIGTPSPFRASRQFSDMSEPVFSSGHPIFEAGDTSVIMHLQLNRTGTVHYAIAPLSKNGETYSSPITTIELESNVFPDFDAVPTSGSSGSKVELSRITYRELINPGTFSGNSDIKTGSQTVGTVDIPIQVNELKPDTDYFVYFVLEGTDSVFSPYVMIYKFRTVPVIRPVLVLNRDTNSQVSISTDITADDNYKLVLLNANSLASTLDGLLNRKFADLVPGFTPESGDENITLLEALAKDGYTTNANGDHPSLFDEYAPDSLKERLRNFIQAASQGDSIVMTGSTSTQAGRPQTIDCNKNMEAGNQYIFFAVAKSPLGSGYAFRANYPVTVTDNVSPYIIKVIGNFNFNDNGQIIGATATIQFNENIYWNNTGSTATLPTLSPIDRGPMLRPDYSGSFISAASLPSNGGSGSGNNVTIAEDGQIGVNTDTINFKLDRAVAPGTITLPSGITDAASNRSRGPINISIRPNVVTDPVTREQYASTLEVEVNSTWYNNGAEPRTR